MASRCGGLNSAASKGTLKRFHGRYGSSSRVPVELAAWQSADEADDPLWPYRRKPTRLAVLGWVTVQVSD